MDTIFALASAPGRAGVAVIRISGPEAYSVASRLSGSLPPARSTALRLLRSEDGELLDQALVLSFEGPNSFTGEDVVEFHIHGSPAVSQAVLSALARNKGARMAEPGEFTRRALENNRLDLSQVEGLADLVDAETEAQRRQALRVFGGGLTDQVETWRKDLIRAAALLEAVIDFADEEVPEDVTPEVTALLQKTRYQVQAEIDRSYVAERVREGFEVAIVGAPNAGKSTLLNYLAGRDAAITSEIAGTTRDVIEVRMDLGGLPVIILDTAGLRDTSDDIERMGIERAVARAEAADIRVFLLSDLDEILPVPQRGGDIVLRAKGDLLSDGVESVSGKTGEGVEQLIDSIVKTLSARHVEGGVATRERHRAAMVLALDLLGQGEERVQQGSEFYDVAAEEIRSAIRTLENLVGRIDVENLLDEIFSSFCLGK